MAHHGEAAGPVAHHYFGWLENESLVIEEPEKGSLVGRIVVGGDAIEEARFCDSTADYVCLFSYRFTFAVPKKLPIDAKEWTLRGVTFELEKSALSISIAGRTFDGLLLIKTPADADLGGRQSGKPAYFLYSPAAGLVGFGRAPVPTPSTTYWMSGRTGFGALKREGDR
jgi:hypothetical protein